MVPLLAETRYEIPVNFNFVKASGAESKKLNANEPFEATPALVGCAKT